MPKVSIIIPSYNHEKYVGKAIKSVLDQSFQDFEIVITDDASIDNTVGEIKKIRDPRIKLFEFKENQGVSVAINNCLDRAQGEFIAHLNSDDIFMPQKLEKQVDYLSSHPKIGAVFSYAQLIDEKGNDYNFDHPHLVMNKQTNKNRCEWLNYFFYKCRWLWHPSMMIRRESYQTLGNHDGRLAQIHDFDFGIRLSLNYDIHILREKLLKFRIRSGDKNVSAETPEATARSMYELSQVLKNFLKIKDVQEFKKIFPKEAKRRKDIIDNELIPFYVARIALDVKHVFHKKFGLDTLFQLLENKNIARKLENICDFNYVSFIQLSGRHDLYNVNLILRQDEHIKSLEERMKQLENPFFWTRNKIKRIMKEL